MKKGEREYTEAIVRQTESHPFMLLLALWILLLPPLGISKLVKNRKRNISSINKAANSSPIVQDLF